MKKHVNYLTCHFHRVESITWLATRTWLQRVLVARLSSMRDSVVINVTKDEMELIWDFLEQMDIAYLHPRRDSLYISLVKSNYANFNLRPEDAIKIKKRSAYHF